MDEFQPRLSLDGNDAIAILSIVSGWLDGGSGVDIAGMRRALRSAGYGPWMER